MGLLTDFWNQLCEFFQIEVAEPIVPETKEPPKPHEPAESVTPLPEKPIAEAPIEEVEPLPSETITEPTPIGEQGRADRIEVLPAKEEPVVPVVEPEPVAPITEPKPVPEAPFLEPPPPEDYPCTMRFHTRCEGMPVAGVNVTFLGQTKTTDGSGLCIISGRAKIRKVYSITASKAGYKTVNTTVSWGFAPPPPPHGSGALGADYRIDMERL